ncbi:MAG: hypothetical protein WA005_14065 [Candidatus Binataceae bacterium]
MKCSSLVADGLGFIDVRRTFDHFKSLRVAGQQTEPLSREL